jgi:hypothetical protein
MKELENTEEIARAVSEILFADEGVNVFSVLDGASVPGLLTRLYTDQPEYVCLYRGELEPDMAEVAPYLVRLAPEANFTDWVIGQGWGKHWGMFAVAHEDLRAMRRHFRTFLMVYDEAGRPFYFRYYDPRVLRPYLPTCNADELSHIFGPVLYYVVEDEEPKAAMRFSVKDGSLKEERVALANE